MNKHKKRIALLPESIQQFQSSIGKLGIVVKKSKGKYSLLDSLVMKPLAGVIHSEDKQKLNLIQQVKTPSNQNFFKK